MDKNAPKEFLKYDDIKASLCGWARFISYQTTNPGSRDPTYKRFEALYEGQYDQGLKNGYVRGITGIDGSCSAGMHEKDVVCGKHLSFKNTGEMAKPEGFYEGVVLKQQITINNFYQSSNLHEIKMKNK